VPDLLVSGRDGEMSDATFWGSVLERERERERDGAERRGGEGE
jgi:hypothetical protein